MLKEWSSNNSNVIILLIDYALKAKKTTIYRCPQAMVGAVIKNNVKVLNSFEKIPTIYE